MAELDVTQVARKTKIVPISEEIPAPRLSDVAYDRILEALFDRKVEAGAFVSQGELSEIVDVPVAPLRDALRVLEAEGILTIHPRSGIQFIKPGLELTRSTYQFRAILERSAVRIYAEQGDEREMADLLARHRAVRETIEQTGLSADAMTEIEALEHSLHHAVIGILRNSLIDTSYHRMHNYLRLLRLDRKMTAPLAMRTLREHIEIIEACLKRDAAQAEAALDAHFQAAMQRNLGFI